MQLLLSADTTDLSYWLNWRVLPCAICVLTPMVAAFFVIWKYEDFGSGKAARRGPQQDVPQLLRGEDAWRPCLREIHPAWLLAYRISAFCLLLTTLIIRLLYSGGHMYFYYTQWTFTLVTIYFGFGSFLSINGCYQYHKLSMRDFIIHSGTDAEQGYYVPLTSEQSRSVHETRNISNLKEASKSAGIGTYLFQVIFQMNAGAVVLTDCIYWFFIFPFLTIKDYDLNFMTVNMHTSNVILLLGDTVLNSLGFPFFRMAYFILWTGAFVIFQWILHACIPVWWPYPFLDLSLPYAPLWYFLVALLHVPCYGMFSLVIRIKNSLFSKWFSHSYVCLR